MPRRFDRGSKKRIAALSPFDDLPSDFWWVALIAAALFALCLLLIYQRM